MIAVAMAALGAGFVPAAHSKSTSSLSPGNSDPTVIGRARLLASYGEPHLALAALRDHGFCQSPVIAELSAGLLAALGQPARAESLLALTPNPSDTDERFRRQVVRARLLLDAGRVQACLATVDAMDSTIVSPYTAYRDLVAAHALMTGGEPARAAAALERARAAAPEALRGEIDAARVDVCRVLNQPRAALAAAEQAADESGPDDARRLLKIRFDIACEIGDTPRAMAAAQYLFDNFRRSPEAQTCAVALAAHADAGETGLLLQCASVLQVNGERNALRSVLRRLDARVLTAAQAEEERLLWAQYHFMGGDYSRAIALARPSYSDPNLQQRSMLIMARSYKRVGRSADAATVYEDYARSFPNDGLSAEALYTAASLYEQMKRNADRDRVLDQLRHAYPSTFHGWAASMARVRELDAAGAHDDAAAIIDQWLVRSRRTDEAALFYAARQRRDAGDAGGGDALLAELRGVNPYSFYSPDLLSPGGAGKIGPTGSLAAWMSGAEEKRDDAFRRVRAQMQHENPDKGMSREASATIARARFFLAAGLRDWGEKELEVARRETGADAAGALELARLCDENAMPWRSVRLYERSRAGIPWAQRQDTADDFRYLTHPVPYPVQVVSAAGREGIAPCVLYGMMREESGFDNDVVSRAGAVGLMQLMPETARALARHVDLKPEAGDRLGDPIVNVSIGSWYAADLLRAGQGSVVWMLAAYNAGPAAANQWIKPGESGDAAIDAVDSIDYKETRAYVKRVVESANVYRALYFDDAPAGSMPH